MSQTPDRTARADIRYQESEDRDEAARRRDQAAAARDQRARARDLRGEEKGRAGLEHASLVSQMLEASSQGGGRVSAADQSSVLHNLLAEFRGMLRDAEADRHAALADREAAAEDRLLAAGDRDTEAAHRRQDAIERAQQAGYPVSSTSDRGAEVVAAARAACARADALCQHLQGMTLSPPSRELLRQSLVARQAARLKTMPVIEQAKGIIMAQRRCGEAEAFELLRHASQRLNRPLRDLAVQLVTSNATAGQPAAARPGPPATQARRSSPGRGLATV
jgi:ANTAR domain